ncbi:MAG: DUF433 domain-containing protein [Tepidisphaerales bacterium]
MTSTYHVTIDDRGVEWIDDTNVKVIEVVADDLAHGTSPEEMHLQYPHLSIAQICAALAYYYDHRAELDARLADEMRQFDQRRAAAADSPGKTKLRRQGLI